MFFIHYFFFLITKAILNRTKNDYSLNVLAKVIENDRRTKAIVNEKHRFMNFILRNVIRVLLY